MFGCRFAESKKSINVNQQALIALKVGDEQRWTQGSAADTGLDCALGTTLYEKQGGLKDGHSKSQG